MDGDLQTWLWLGSGLLMLASEFVALNLVVGFLGAGALTVGALRAGGLIESFPLELGLWGVLSGVYLLLLRKGLRRAFGAPEKTRDTPNEDLQAYGTLVDVIEETGAEEPGRIRWQGTTWKAHTQSGVLRAGSKARLLHRDNIGWVVEAAEPGVDDEQISTRSTVTTR